MPGSGGGRRLGRMGGGAWVSVRSCSRAAVTAQAANAAITKDSVAGDRGIQTNRGLVQAEAVLTEFEILFGRPAQPGGPDQPGRGGRLAWRHVAIVEGQLQVGRLVGLSASDRDSA